MNWKDLSWQHTVLLGIAIPSSCALIYGLANLGESIAGIAAAVGGVLAAMGWQASRQKAQIDEVRADVGKVEKLANGNLSRADAARDAANQKAIEHLHVIYQQAIQLAAMTPPGTVIPAPLPALVGPLAKPDDPANAGHI